MCVSAVDILEIEDVEKERAGGHSKKLFDFVCCTEDGEVVEVEGNERADAGVGDALELRGLIELLIEKLTVFLFLKSKSTSPSTWLMSSEISWTN